MSDQSDEQYSAEETARRRDDAIRRALNTPPTPHKEMVGRVSRAQSKRGSRRRSRPVEKRQNQP